MTDAGDVDRWVELVHRPRRHLAGPAAALEAAENGSPVGADDHVVGVDRAVDDAEVVQVGEGGSQGRHEAGDLLGRQRPEDGQRGAVDRGGDEDRSLGAALDVDQLDHAGVPGRRQQFGFPVHPVGGPRVVRPWVVRHVV